MKIPKPRKLPSGSWFIQLRLGGESIAVTEPTEKQCIKTAQLIKAEHLAGKRVQDKNTRPLRDACTDYIETRRSRLSPSSILGYEKIRDVSFNSIMDKPINTLSWHVLDKAISEECSRIGRRGKPISPKTVHDEFMFILSVLKTNGTKYEESFSLPELKRKPIQILPAEVIYDAVKGTPIELPCLLAMWLTMSISEIRGLTKSKSIRNGQITILETVLDIKGEVIRKEGGKEAERTRVQDIPPYIQNLIDNVEGDIICPLSSHSVNARLTRLLKKADLPHISFHKLRHVSASTMALLNIPANYAQEKGGWKTNYTMQTVYTHTFTAERKAADNKMDSFFDDIIKNANENANK